MLKQLTKLIDVKSLITIGLVITLIVVTLFDKPVEEKVFNLFSNVLTMVMTYFFTKKSNNAE
jgi:uncharacterized protein YacL